MDGECDLVCSGCEILRFFPPVYLFSHEMFFRNGITEEVHEVCSEHAETFGKKKRNKTNPKLKANTRTENTRNYFEKLHGKLQFCHQELD